MAIQNIKQILLNRIAAIRIAEANRSSDANALINAKKKFDNLLAEEVTFSFTPTEGVTNGFTAVIDVSKTRGYKLTGQRFITAQLFAVAEPKASIVTTDEDIARIVKPGLYISNESGEIHAVLDADGGLEDIYNFLGYSFEADEMTIDTNKTLATVSSKVVAGDINLSNAFEGDSDLGTLTMTADKTDVNVGDTITLSTQLLGGDGKALANEKIELKIAGESVSFSNDEITTDKDGKGSISVWPSKAGSITINAFFGIYLKAKTLNITAKLVAFKIASFTLDRNTYTVGTDTDAPTVTLKIVDQDGNPAPGQKFTLEVDGQTAESQVDDNGVFSGSVPFVEPGDHVITVTFNGETKSVTVTVINDSVGVTVGTYASENATAVTSSFVAGSIVYVRASVTSPGGNPLSGESVVFSGSGFDNITATTDTNGIAKGSFTATKAATTPLVITATCGTSSGQTGAAISADTSSVSLVDTDVTRDTASIVTGNSAVIKAVVRDKYSNPVSGQSVEIVINDESTSVQTDNTGTATYTFTPAAGGDQDVLVNFKSKTIKTFTFSVNGDPTTATLNSTGLTTNGSSKYVNDYVTPEVTIVDANGHPVSGVKVVFTGSDGQTSEATSQDGNGVASGSLQLKATGDYSITVALGGKTVGNTATVKVTEKVVYTYQDPGVQPTSADVKVGDTVSPYVIVLDKDSKVVSGITVTFSGYGDNKTAVTDANGKATVDYVFNEAGQYFIGTDINDENPSNNSCVVKVTAA